MFASKKFRDVFAFKNTGMYPGVWGATPGSTSMSPIAWSNFRKLEWVFQLGSVGSANTTFTLIFQTASASNGTFTTRGYLGSSGFTTTAGMLAGSVYSNQVLPVDMRGEWLYSVMGGQSIGYVPWIQVLLSNSNSSLTCALLTMGYLMDYEPAFNYDSSSYVAWTGSAETDAY
jgi:hypothetical protein